MVDSSGTHILFVDDEEEIRKAVGEMLQKLGYTCEVAPNGSEALKCLKRQSFDLVISDIVMPGMDGIQLMQEAKGVFPHLDFIIMTGYGDDYTYEEIIRKGASDYMTKPIEIKELKARIERVERERRAEAALKEANENLGRLYNQLQQDHKIAEKVLAKMVHRGCLDAPNIKYLISPMAIFNGDMLLAARRPSGELHVMLGDFTAHGLSASLGAIPASDIFYAMTSKGFNTGEIAMEMNKKLNDALPTGLFLAVCLIQLDGARGTLTLWNGALPDVVVVGREGGIKNRLKSRNVPLGVVSGVKLDSTTEIIEIAQGDRIFVYSDGLIEAHKPGGEMFGQERLDKYFSRNQAPDNLFDKIRAGLATFCKGAPQSDDITMIEITCDKEAVLPIKIEPPSDPARTYMMSWKMVTELKPDSLRTGDPLPLVTRILAEDKRLSRHKENVYMVLAELFSNALEYGLLRLDPELKKDAKGFDRYYIARERALADLKEGLIKIDLEHLSEHEGGKLVVRIEDSGPGFDYHKILPSLGENITLGGRGIPLLRSLCKELVYHGRGNRVEAVYVWS